MAKFKAGDAIRVIKGYHSGKSGTVIHPCWAISASDWPLVVFTDGDGTRYSADENELVFKERNWCFVSHDSVEVDVLIDPETVFFFVEIRAGGEFKAAQGGPSLTSLLLFVGQQLYRTRVEGLLSLDGENFLHQCLESVKL